MGVVGEACASCELVLEGVVGEASELWNKDPVVMPLTWDMVSVLQHFHWYCWAAAGDSHPPVLPLGAGLCLCALSVSWELLKLRGPGDIRSNLWLCLFVRGPL